MAEIKHLIETDYKGNYNNMGERIEAIEKEIHDSTYMTLTNENVRSFQVGKGSNGVSIALDSTNSAMGLEGQTLVNLVPKAELSKFQTSAGISNIDDDGYITMIANGNWRNAFWHPLDMVKPNTLYTIVVDVKEYSLEGGLFYITSNHSTSHSQFPLSKTIGSSGLHILTQTSKDTFTDVVYSLRSYVDQNATSGSITYRVMLFKGDHTNKPIEYFEGLMSVGQSNDNKIEISSVGKNLFDGNLISGICDYANPENIGANRYYRSIKVLLDKGTYIFSLSNDISLVRAFTDSIRTQHIERTALELKTLSNRKFQFTLGKMENVYLTFRNIISSETDWNEDTIIQIEKGTVQTDYEPYKVNKTEILLNEPLRSVPNVVKDTMEIKDGKLIVHRHCKEVELNGSETWEIFKEDENYIQYVNRDLFPDIPLYQMISSFEPYISDAFISTRTDSMDKEFIRIYRTATFRWTMICLNKKKSILTLEAFKTWLQNNPVKVIYQLETPITEEYDLLNPILYKDGHVFLETGAIPCSSVSHEVALNTKAQVKNNSKAIASSRDIYDGMVSEYDEMLLELDYDHTVFDFEYNISKLKLEEV